MKTFFKKCKGLLYVFQQKCLSLCIDSSFVIQSEAKDLGNTKWMTPRFFVTTFL